MKYDIVCAPSYSLLEMTLNEGESVIVEPGSMAWMDTTVKPKTEMKGDYLQDLKEEWAVRVFSLILILLKEVLEKLVLRQVTQET